MKEDQINKLKLRIKELERKLKDKDSNWDYSKSFDEYSKMREPETLEISKLDLEIRLNREYSLRELPKKSECDIMSIEQFIEFCKDGSFIDYDGSGYYCIDNKMSDIVIYPSDVISNNIRQGFDKIVWYNR